MKGHLLEHQLLDEVISSTEPPTGASLEVLMRAKPTLLVDFGLLQQSRRSLQGLMALSKAGFADASIPLVRTIFENTVTGSWLIEEEKNDALAKFLGAQRTHLKDSVNEGALPQEFIDQYDSLMDAWVGHHRSSSLPGLKKRLGPTLRPAYDIYRQLSARSHGSMIGVVFQFALDDNDDLILAAPDQEEAESNISFSAQMVVALAAKCWGSISEEVQADLIDLYKRLRAASSFDVQDL